MWSAADIVIVLSADDTDDPVVTAEIKTPAGTLRLMAEPEWPGRVLILHGCHMHGEDVGPNAFGWRELRWLAAAAMEVLDVDEIRVEGEVRTSGANPGRRPRPLRFARKIRSEG
jgi:hypothetical protein